MDDLIIRAPRPEERAASHELTLAAYAQYAELMPESAWAALRAALRGALAASEAATQFVAEQAGALVGSVFLFPPAEDEEKGVGGRMRSPELRLLAVAPAARGHGIGEALVRACLAEAQRVGYPALGLYSSETMQAALALYARLGFERTPEDDFRVEGSELIQAFCYRLTPLQ